MSEATRAREILTVALDAGWGGSLARFKDFCEHPYVTLTVQHPDSGDTFRATWATHETGTYRLRGVLRKGGGRLWRNSTLKALTTAIEATV